MSLADRIFVHFKRISAVFEFVRNGYGIRWKFPGLSHRDETDSELIRERGTEDKSAGFDADNRIDIEAAAEKKLQIIAERLNAGYYGNEAKSSSTPSAS